MLQHWLKPNGNGQSQGEDDIPTFFVLKSVTQNGALIEFYQSVRMP